MDKKELFYGKDHVQVWLKLEEAEREQIKACCEKKLVSKNSFISMIVKNYLKEQVE